MSTPETFIGDHPPRDGREWECQCARCGSSVEWEDCYECEDGFVSRYEEDPLWYDRDDLFECDLCRGNGGWNLCVSSEEWCQANPLEGREDVPSGTLEWYTFDPAPDPKETHV